MLNEKGRVLMNENEIQLSGQAIRVGLADAIYDIENNGTTGIEPMYKAVTHALKQQELPEEFVEIAFFLLRDAYLARMNAWERDHYKIPADPIDDLSFVQKKTWVLQLKACLQADNSFDRENKSAFLDNAISGISIPMFAKTSMIYDGPLKSQSKSQLECCFPSVKAVMEIATQEAPIKLKMR